MRIPLLVTLVLFAATLTGCAGGGSGAAAPDGTRVSLGPADPGSRADANQNLAITNDPTTGEAIVEASLPRAWTALEEMVSRNELPVTESDPRAGRMVVRGRMPRLDGARMSRWFDCGRDMTGPVADRATVQVVMGLQLAPVSTERTRVDWTIQASARPRYNSDNIIACNPRAELHDYLLAQLGAGLPG
jgi:hypothetical protein